ncbi:unnamed protein product [Debaryomyces fabryi]|nr:unnamed protein product [Debaryomyces fabryi]
MSNQRNPESQRGSVEIDSVSINSSPSGTREEDNDLADEESQTVESNDSNIKQKSWRNVLFLSFTSLGGIYGDLGTSPLYVLNSIEYANSPPSQSDIYGAISLIFYVFTFIVILKYVMIVLFIGPNNGEGGQVAIYAKIARALKIGPKGVTIPGTTETSDLELLSRQETSRSFILNSKDRFGSSSNFKNNPKLLKLIAKFILFCCFLGCSLVISDGLLTPTTSVLSAIAGIQIAKPSFDNVLVVSEVVLVFLFVIQQFGSHKISFLFAPIIFLWLISLFICGIFNIVRYHPQIFRALSPYYAISLLQKVGIDAIGGAMLSITGTEAMFADIGHFGRLPIQLALTFFVYPILIISYLGQGAYLIEHPEDVRNPFFLSIPGGSNSGIFWVVFVLATLSTIIASQALILGVFSILSQLIKLDCFPTFRILHVSKHCRGKVYIPTINWILMIGVCCTTAGFKTSNNVTSAYGLGIAFDLIVTSTLVSICMVYVYNWNIIIPVCFVLIFVPLEAVLVISNLKKIMHGAWFPIMMASLFMIFFSFWRWARSKAVEQNFNTRTRISDLYPSFRKVPENKTVDLSHKPEDESWMDLGGEVLEYGIELPKVLNSNHNKLDVRSKFGSTTLQRHKGVGIMYCESSIHILQSPNTVPQIYRKLVSSFASIPSVFIFCSIRILPIPDVPNSERVLIGSMKIPGHYRCIIRFGFMEEILINSDLNNTILSAIPDVQALIKSDETIPGINKVDDIPILHIFENNAIRSHTYSEEQFKTKNPFFLAARYIRRVLINQIYSPLSSITEYNDKLVSIVDEDNETEKKLLIGEVIRI